MKVEKKFRSMGIVEFTEDQIDTRSEIKTFRIYFIICIPVVL